MGRGFQTTKTKTTNGFSGHFHEQKETKSSPAKHANDANGQRGFQTTKTKTTNGFSGHLHEQRKRRVLPLNTRTTRIGREDFGDQGTPAPLRNFLSEHTVATAMEMTCSKLSNGEPLDAAEKQFDLLITTDKMLPAQQNLSARKIAILILPFASWPRLKPHVAKVASQIRKLRAGECVELQLE